MARQNKGDSMEKTSRNKKEPGKDILPHAFLLHNDCLDKFAQMELTRTKTRHYPMMFLELYPNYS